ncbi:efflux transporter outer membrane subunit [Silvibacterium dinghuense]|uniref:Efflux transporter outer membrane subunit n=2 Tax=Silvibacterium dinghuense TaxID=1560006 RepID=A0A4Q1SKU3_9BACT|nr:efflux transporter outer membrane subunit [Silvibacterium dinghuense]
MVSAGAAALLSVWLAGCMVGPNYKRPQVAPPPAYRGADNAVTDAAQTASVGDQNWATVFQEPELQDLIRTALKNNYDVQIAAKRVLEQQAQVKITRAAEFPTLSGGGTGLGAELPNSLGNQVGSNPLADGSFSFSAAWTPDFWGQYRRATEGARATLLQQVWAQRAVRMSVVQQVATAYFTIRALDRQLEISQETVKIRQQSVDLTKRLTDGGSSPLSDLRQAEESLYTATSEIPQLEQQIQEEENALRLLLGQDPGTVAHTDPHALDPVPQALPTGIPSQLLERRPDILEAEEQLINANAQIGVAKAQFFPQLSISASAGLGGDEWSNLFDPGGHTVYGIGSLTQAIFEGGKLKGQLNLAKAQKEEMVLNYQKTIKGAFRDVSNALITVNKTRATREQQERLVASAEDASRLARMRYQGGATSYLEVLTTDATLYSAQLNLVTAQQNEALSLVTLYDALGGGWQE